MCHCIGLMAADTRGLASRREAAKEELPEDALSVWAQDQKKKKNVAFRDAIYCDLARVGTGKSFDSGYEKPDLWINGFGWCVGGMAGTGCCSSYHVGYTGGCLDKVNLCPCGALFNTGILELTQMTSRVCSNYFLIIILCFLINARPRFLDFIV